MREVLASCLPATNRVDRVKHCLDCKVMLAGIWRMYVVACCLIHSLDRPGQHCLDCRVNWADRLMPMWGQGMSQGGQLGGPRGSDLQRASPGSPG